jgi:hypothetical protein
MKLSSPLIPTTVESLNRLSFFWVVEKWTAEKRKIESKLNVFIGKKVLLKVSKILFFSSFRLFLTSNT